MKLNQDKIFKISLFLSFSITLIGVMFKLMHWPGGSYILAGGVLFSLLYIVIALTTIFPDPKIPLFEKFLWLVGFIFTGQITGFLYYFMMIKPKYQSNSSH